MSNSDHPIFEPHIAVGIEAAQIHVDEHFWKQLQRLLVNTPSAERTIRLNFPDMLPAPPEPKRPMALRMAIVDYARSLFIAEGNLYQNSPLLENWLRSLAERIADRVLQTVVRLEEVGKNRGTSFAHHGLTQNQMREAAVEELNTLIASRMKPAPTKPPLPPDVQEQMVDSWQPPHHKGSHGSVVKGEVLLSSDGTTIGIHGLGGYGTPLLAQKGREQIYLPSATVRGWSPSQGSYVAWDGKDYSFHHAEENVLSNSLLTLIGEIKREGPPESKVASPSPSSTSISAQLKSLREESDLSHEALAERLGIDVRNVYRHFAGETKPRPKQIKTYEALFTEALDRPIKLKRH